MKRNFLKILFVTVSVTFAIFLSSCKNTDDDETQADNSPKTCVVTLNANGGQITGTTKYTLNIGEYWRIPEASSLGLTKAQCYLKGWALDASATEKKYADNGAFFVQAQLTLYAVWEEIKQVSYTANSAKSLQSIIDAINKNNIDSDILESKTTYTIYIDGELSGETKIQDETNTAIGQKVKLASSILLVGKNNGTDMLIGASEGTILFISTAAPITIKNLTLKGGKGYEKAGKKYGGAIYIEGESADVTIDENTILKENSADNGGAVYLTTGTVKINSGVTLENNTAENGAAIYNDNGQVTVNDGAKITLNSASVSGGGIYSKGLLTVSGGNISSNTAILNGGGLYLASSASLTDAKIELNTAENGGGIFVEKGSVTNNSWIIKNNANAGAGLYNKGSFTLEGSSISGNNASTNGAGIYNEGTFVITGGFISNNTSSENGGGIYNCGGEITFNNGKIESNTAKKGGGIYNKNTSVTMGTHTLKNGKDVVAGNINGNTATESGGGVFNESGAFSLLMAQDGAGKSVSGSIKENVAPENCGKSWYKSGGTITIRGNVQTIFFSDTDI